MIHFLNGRGAGCLCCRGYKSPTETLQCNFSSFSGSPLNHPQESRRLWVKTNGWFPSTTVWSRKHTQCQAALEQLDRQSLDHTTRPDLYLRRNLSGISRQGGSFEVSQGYKEGPEKGSVFAKQVKKWAWCCCSCRWISGRTMWATELGLRFTVFSENRCGSRWWPFEVRYSANTLENSHLELISAVYNCGVNSFE